MDVSLWEKVIALVGGLGPYVVFFSVSIWKSVANHQLDPVVNSLGGCAYVLFIIPAQGLGYIVGLLTTGNYNVAFALAALTGIPVGYFLGVYNGRDGSDMYPPK